MKIKHFSGYGNVQATKVSKTTRDGVTTMVIEVKGNHERGINLGEEGWRHYDIYKWLLSKFDKSVKDDNAILSVKTNETWEREIVPSNLMGQATATIDVDVCLYTITYTI